MDKQLQAAAPAILNALPDPLIVVDASSHIRLLNIEAEHFFQTGVNALIGINWRNLWQDYLELCELPERVLQKNTTIILRNQAVEDQRIGNRVMDVTGCLMMLEEKPHVLVRLHLYDLSVRLNESVQRQKGLRQINQITRMLAHEIKNPLAGIRGAAQLMRTFLPKKEHGWADMIITESDRVTRLVERLEGLETNPNFARKPLNIHEILDHVYQLSISSFANSKFTGDVKNGLKIERHYDPSLPLIFGNKDALIQIFINLIKNAAEAVDKKQGCIRIITAYATGVWFHSETTGDAVSLPIKITIEDNGAGIAPEIYPHLFEPFATNKQAGRGIGLTLTAKLIHDHHGQIEAVSKSGKTQFKVFLPIFQK